jgi:acetylornithine/succinyldiaminopimelate/putrescine aminotransferase
VGDWFAANIYKTIPDIMIIGKGLGGGFPLFGTLSPDNLEPFQPGDHSFTFAHFPVSMAAGLACIEAIEEEGLQRGVVFGEAKYLGLGNIVKVKPPIVITEAQVERVLEVFEEITQKLSA